MLVELQDDEMVLKKAYYQMLMEDSIFLECLEVHGVDNWMGYAEAGDEFDRIMEEEEGIDD